jgi:RNA 2',3'-cyclic 3'-phosphodiesterase
LVERLTWAAARTATFALRLAGAGTFPSQSGRAKQVWMGVDGDVERLTRLAERCVAAGRRESLHMESRRYRPHLTLARARKTTTDATEVVKSLSSYQGEPWPVTELKLMKSTLGPHVNHETLATLPLSERPYQA